MRACHLALIYLVAALAACTPTTGPTAAPALPPLDAAAAQREVQARFPDASAFALHDANGNGFRFAPDGSAEFAAFGARTDLRAQTRVTSVTGNTICLAEAGGWGGACLDLYGTLDGPIQVDVTFSNGARRSYQSALSVAPR
jgi:hypothetical protein